MALNGRGETKHGAQNRLVAPPTLPKIRLGNFDIEEEARAAAAKVAERRVIRQGLDCWREIGKVETLEAWRKIGAALHIGKLRAIRVTRSNSGWGSAYSKEFGRWCREFGFTMSKAARSWAIALHENADSIEKWRSRLSERERKKLKNPQSIVRRWQKETHANGKCPQDLAREAKAAWRRFIWCVKALPPNEARPLWQAVAAEASLFV